MTAMVTSLARKSKVVEALQAGVANPIVKPFEPGQLKQKITSLVAK